MWASAWPLVLLAVAAGLAQHSDDTATTTFVTDVDLAAVTEATTILPDVPMTTVAPVVTKPNASGVPVDELMIVAKLNGAADGAADEQQDARARRLLVPGAVVVPLDPNTRLPPPSTLPSLDGDPEEDFMEDMQEIEQGSDMVMAERSAAPVAPVPQHQDQEDVLSLSDPLPLNHKKSRRDFSPSDTNSLAGKQHRFVTVAPPEQDIEKRKYERMMAKLPVRDYPGYNITGRDKPLNVVFVFPRVSEGNQTRPRELEVVLVFPQANASTAAPSATEATTTPTSVPSVSVVDEATGVDDSDDKLELASERKETRESAPSHLTANDITLVPSKATSTVATPTTSEPTTAATTTSPSTSTTTPSTTPAPVTTTSTTPVPTSTTTVAVHTPSPAFHRWKQEPGAYRQDIYKKYANKYASSRPPPVSFFRKENASVATRRTGDDDGDLDTGASEVRHAFDEAPWAAARRRAPAPVYIPARMHAARPPPHFPSLPPTGMQPMLIVVPPLAAKAINDTLPTAAESATLPETLPDAISITPETSTLVPITPAPAVLVPAVPVSRGHARRGRPYQAGRPAGAAEHDNQSANAPAAVLPTAQVDPATSTAAAGAHPVELKRTHVRRRPLRNRQQQMDTLTTTTSQPTTLRTRIRPHFRPQSRPQDAQRVHPQPTARPGASHTILGPFMMALRERLPGARPVLPSAGTLEAVDTTTKPSTAAGPTQALSGEDVATIKKIEALQSGQVDLAPTNRMARLSSLQSMLVANLVALQRELAERHADLRRHMDSLHLPAEHRAEGSARTFESSTSTPATPVTVTTGPMRRKYRRPPAFRKPPAPAEDKEQAVNDNKIPYQTLFKKRTGGPTGKLSVGEATATTTTASTTTTTTAAPTTTSPIDVMTTTVVDDHEIVTDAPATTTEANVEGTTTFAAEEDRNAPTSEDPVGIGTTEALSITTSYPSSTASSTPQTELDVVGSTDSATDIGAEGSAPAVASAPAPAPVAAALTAGSAGLQGPAEQLPGVADGLQQGLLGFQPSPRDPVLRPSRAGRGPGRLALLGGVLPEDDPAVASGLFSLDRRDRSAFRAPVQLEGGFLPMIPGSVGALQSAGAPQIVGPIPGGYRDVLRGSPVQLDLPRPDRPSDFLRRPVAPAAPAAPAAPVAPSPIAPVAPRFVQRVQRVPVRTAAVTAPLRQG